jgi:hypothetical protein
MKETITREIGGFVLRPKAAQQTITPKGGGFVLPERVKQSSHEVLMVSLVSLRTAQGFNSTQ